MWLILFSLLGILSNIIETQNIALPESIAFGQLINRLEQCKYLQNITSMLLLYLLFLY